MNKIKFQRGLGYRTMGKVTITVRVIIWEDDTITYDETIITYNGKTYDMMPGRRGLTECPSYTPYAPVTKP